MAETLEQDLATLSNARIFFGHMSVGGNIIDGLKDIVNDNKNSPINIIQREIAHPLPDKFILHSSIGKNSDPLSKCMDYKNIIETELKNKIDYAMFKFCYIDIDENTNIEELFLEYRKVIDELIISYPNIRFIHVTSALRHSESGPYIWIRELLGSPNRSKLANIKRNKFNQLLRNTYVEQPIFDLAKAESSYPDGQRETFTYNSKEKYYGLIGDYTYDGGHLNEYGRSKVARDFVTQIADIIRKN